MATEAQRQQQLLSSGWLDKIGQGNDVLELDQVEQVFVKWMGRLVEALQKNINSPNGKGQEITASGALSESIRFEYSKNGVGYQGVVYMVDYADFRDKGVQGIGPNSKNTTSPYKFRTAFPSKNMQNALLMWVREKNLLSEITAPKGLLGKNTRNYLRNKDRSRQLVIALGKSIKQHGIEASNFKQVSVDEILQGMTQELAEAMVGDIVLSIDTAKLY